MTTCVSLSTRKDDIHCTYGRDLAMIKAEYIWGRERRGNKKQEIRHGVELSFANGVSRRAARGWVNYLLAFLAFSLPALLLCWLGEEKQCFLAHSRGMAHRDDQAKGALLDCVSATIKLSRPCGRENECLRACMAQTAINRTRRPLC